MYLDFQKKCDRGSRPLPETIAFVGIPEHNPSISESMRRALNAEILNSAGAGLVRPTEMATLKLLAPFLTLDKKGQDELRTAEERIAGSPLAILTEVRRPSIDILELDLSFLDKRPGCSDSIVQPFFVKLSTLKRSRIACRRQATTRSTSCSASITRRSGSSRGRCPPPRAP